MDKLSGALLICSFMYNSLLTFVMLLVYLYINIIQFNYATLFSIWFCFVYWMFDFLNIIFIVFNSATLLCCACLYWYNIDNKYLMTVPLIKHNVNKLQHKNNQYKTYIIDTLTNNTDIRKKQLMHTQTALIKYYAFATNTFDKLCNIIYNTLCKIRSLTSDIPGCKNIYSMYDSIFIYIDCIQLLKTTQKTGTTKTFGSSPLDGNIFNMMNNMSAEEKKQINNMTKEFMKSFNMNNIVMVPPSKKYE